MNQPKKKRPTWKRLARIVLKTILFLFLFFILIFLLILTPPVQNFIRKKTVTYLENKLHTKVQVGRIYIGLPKKVVIEDIYIEDRQKDTLLAGGLIKADIAIFKLFQGNVDIRSLTLENITAKVKRQLPDTVFNFQFIIDAFNPPGSASSATDTASSTSSFSIRSVVLNTSRLVYKDVITGNDVEAWINHLDTRVNSMDPATMRYDIDRIRIDGLVARVYQAKPLLAPGQLTVKTPQTGKAITPQLTLGELDLKKVNLDYRNDVSGLYTTANIGALLADPEKIDLSEQVMQFGKISLQNTVAAIRIAKKPEARETIAAIKEKADSSIEKGWRLLVGSFLSENNTLQFDNDNLPRQRTGMDYAHLKASPFVLQASNFLLSDDSITARIEKASFKEQSGFELQELHTDFLYSSHGAYLHDLYLKTPGTELKRNATIHYASLEVFKHDIGNVQLDLDLDNSKILVSDVLTFAPALRSQPAFAYPGATWYIDSRIRGRLADLTIDALQIQGLRDTRIDIKGKVKGLPNMDTFSADLTIHTITSSRRDIDLFIPAGTLPQQITLPGRLSLSGWLKGNTRSLTTALSARTDLGDATIKGTFGQLNDPKHIQYDAVVQTRSVDLGTILQDRENLGPVSATFSVNGSGFDPKTANASFNGKIHSAVVKQYTYHDLDLKGTLANQQAVIDAFVMDPNIHVTLNATADLSGPYPAVQVSGMIDSLKTQPLHLTAQPFIYRGKIDGDFRSTNPDDLDGTLYITQFLMVQNGQRLQLDTLEVLAGRSANGHSIQLNSEIINARLEGQYKLTQLGGVFQQAIQPYFAMAPGSTTPVQDPYDFTLNAWVINSNPLKAFLPALEKMDSLTLQSHFSNAAWNATVTAPTIDYGSYHIRGLSAKAGTGNDSIQVNILASQIASGALNFYGTSLNASLANNTIHFTTDIKDKAGKSRYNLAGLFRQPQPGQYSFSFAPEGLLLNYERWSVPADNQILFTGDNLIASNFVLRKNGQQLSINSLSQNTNAPLEVKFENFRLATITAFVQNDSTLVDGRMNGTINFTNIVRDPIFKGQLNITDLSVKNDTIGNAVISVNNTTANTYVANAVLSGRGNDVTLDGKYFVNPGGNSSFDLDLNIVQLPMTTVQAFSAGSVQAASGHVNGKFDITGTLQKPAVRGNLNFNQAAFNLTMLNSYFRIDQEKIEINETGIRFNRFQVKDSAGNTLVLDGTAATSNFRNYQFDFRIRANNFQALNSTKQHNRLFYGKLFFNSNLRVQGTEETPVIDGNITVNENTKLTIVLPQREPGVVDREGIVEFVDMDAPLNDSLFLAAYDSLNTTLLRGLDVAANIEIKKEAEFSLIIDEGNGDFLNVKGEALLTSGIDPSGKLTLAGSYEIEQGSYELTFNFIKRKFEIEKGSKIIWLGEPTDADVTVTARYTANTAPLDLVKNQLGELTAAQRNTYLEKIPFDVLLKMEGKLLQPQISFDITLPENKNYDVSNDILTNVRTRLDMLRQEPGEMNKQVFALLLLNRFVGENPFNSSSQGLTANTLARQSVSKLLAEQLNRLAEDLIKGVDLNFDILSSEDYSSGERRDRTDLNVGLSKKLLNDRLSVSVGSNFELEGAQNSNQKANNIAGNIAVNYRLSKDGRYLLRAYRKNEYEGIIDGYIIETGVSFIISLDYNRFREIFQNQAERRKNRQARRQQRQEDRQKANAEMKEAQQPQP